MVGVQDPAVLLPGHNDIAAVPHALPEGQGGGVGAVLSLGELPLGAPEADVQVLQKDSLEPFPCTIVHWTLISPT